MKQLRLNPLSALALALCMGFLFAFAGWLNDRTISEPERILAITIPATSYLFFLLRYFFGTRDNS
jgi:hypothetical protein